MSFTAKHNLLPALLFILTWHTHLTHADIRFTAPGQSVLNISNSASPIRIAWTLDGQQASSPDQFPSPTVELWLTGTSPDGSTGFSWGISKPLPLPETTEYTWDHVDFVNGTKVSGEKWVFEARWRDGGNQTGLGSVFKSGEYELVGSQNIVTGAAARVFDGARIWSAVLVGLVVAVGGGML